MNLEDILQWWSFVFLGVLVYSMGEGIKQVFPNLVKHKWYVRTVVFHGTATSTALAALPFFPMPDALGTELGTRLLFGAVAGICASWSYKALMRLLGKDTKTRRQEE